MSFAIRGEMTGLDSVLKRMKKLRQGARNKILRPAVRDAIKPLAKHAQFLAPVRSGMLRRALGMRINVYRNSGTVVGLVGPRTGFRKTKQGRQATALGRAIKEKGINPTKYAHLVELGTVHSRPYPFLRPAWDAGKAGVEATIAARVRVGLEKLAQ